MLFKEKFHTSLVCDRSDFLQASAGPRPFLAQQFTPHNSYNHDSADSSGVPFGLSQYGASLGYRKEQEKREENC